MPLSEDEYDSQSGFTSETGNSQSLSKAELRKTNKPIMEKKRRARINNCLNELKDLLLDAMNKDPARHSKLEKADILELTVKHLQAVQRQQLAAAVASDPAVLHRFRSGFGDCASEVRRYLSRLAPPTLPGLRSRLASHLDTCINGIERIAPNDFPKLHDRFLDRLIEGDKDNDKLGLRDPGLRLADDVVGPRMEDRAAKFDRLGLDNVRIGLKLEDRTKLGLERSGKDSRKTDLRFEDRRQSAFRYVRRPSSPPLSPMSCDSACDSSTEPETPPRPQITLIPQITYPTPPSRSASDQDSSPETQKPTVSSTTISPESRVQQTALDLKSKKYAEPLSIVIDVENYKIGIDASPKRPLDYRHKLKRTSHSQIERSSKVPKLDIPIQPLAFKTNPEISKTTVFVPPNPAIVDTPRLVRTVISHTAESLAESSVNINRSALETRPVLEKPAPQKREDNLEADTSSRSPEQKAHGSGDTVWRPW